MPKIEFPPKTKTAPRGDGSSSRSHKVPGTTKGASTKSDLAIRPKEVSKMVKMDGTMRPKEVSKMAKMDQTLRPKELPKMTKNEHNQKSTAKPKSTKEDQAKLALIKARPSGKQKTDSGQRELAKRDHTANTETHSENTTNNTTIIQNTEVIAVPIYRHPWVCPHGRAYDPYWW